MNNLQPKMESHILEDDGVFPNSTLPVILYESAVALAGSPADDMETVFKANGWGNEWRNGVYDYHHYHSTAHEVLGVYSGQIKLQLGGPKGIVKELKTGDVVIIPAGVAHKNVGSSKDFKCVGAYPGGQDYDTNYGKPGERPGTDENIRKLPLPLKDPVFGLKGPMVKEWTT